MGCDIQQNSLIARVRPFPILLRPLAHPVNIRYSGATAIRTFIEGIGLEGSTLLHSLSLLRFHVAKTIAAIPPAVMAVFAFQFEGRDHQPPESTSWPRRFRC
jgi:hypothetical protein